MRKLLLGILSMVCMLPAHAQLERKLENEDPDIDLTFHAPRHINLFTVEPLDKKSMHFAIMHTFGPVDGGVQNLFGLDNGASIQFSFEFALSEKFSAGFSRSSRDKVYNVFGRYHLFSQTSSNSRPFSLSLAGGAGVNSSNYEFLNDGAPDFSERTSYFGQVMLARKFDKKFSLQVSPMLAYFVAPLAAYQIEGDENLYLALGISAKYKVSSRSSLTLQMIPNLNTSLRSNWGVGWDVEAGGHVFQMYFVTSPFLNEQYLLAGGNGNFGEKFRLGFNVNRIFGLGQRR